MTQDSCENGDSIKAKPTLLYKYRALDGESLSYVQQTIRHNEIYFASPKQFNDPYDCKVHWSFDAPDIVVEEFYDGLLIRMRPDLINDHKKRRLIAIEWVKSQKLRDPNFQEELVADMQQNVNKLGVFCLTEKPDDIVMWSHYARSHTGICLEFTAGPNTPFFKHDYIQKQKVNYVEDYPSVHIILDLRERQVEAIIFTKAIFWKCEREWRLVDHKNGAGIQSFSGNLLTGVILGSQIGDEHRKIITEWVREREAPTQLYEAKLKRASYGLDIVPIK